jgi:tRNA A-37 threonylcarbamoyl transferase component Bud32
MNYQKIKISSFRLQLSGDFPAGFFLNGTDTSFFADGQRSSFVKLPSSKFTRVFKFDVYFKGKIHNLILKQYLNRSLLDVLKNLLRPCRAQRAFKAGKMLKQHGFSTPDIVAAGKKTFAGITTRNFLVTSEVKDSVSLPEILSENTPEKCELIRRFGEIVGKMHAGNIFHGDLRLGNVLVKTNNDQFVFIFLDNERTKKFRKLPRRLRLKNLVQISMFRDYISNSDRIYFLDTYLTQQNIKLDREKLAAEITAGIEKRLAAKGIKTD